MDTYDMMRHFADSWGLLAMVLFFLGVVLRSVNPARGAEMAEAAAIPLDDRAPKDFEGDVERKRGEGREGKEA